ncbi:MAG: DUF885 domain-containing protein [Saprospiraceae bacterium]|nr:DUF885 domain-containing protein [Saprospiraceae bacterium]
MGFKAFILLISIGFIASCSAGIKKLSKESANFQNILTELATTKFNDDTHPLGNPTKENFEKRRNFYQKELAALKQLRFDKLSEDDQISVELLIFELQDNIDEINFETYLNPIQADQGFHLNLVYRIRPINSSEEADRYLRTLNDMPHFASSNIALIREGLERGLSQPRIIFNGYEDTYNHHIVDVYSKSDFYQPFLNLSSILSEAKKDSILTAAKLAIEASVIPAFKTIKNFFEEEYFPKTRTSLGVSEVPGGKDFYQNRINFYTTSTDYTPESIHELGLREVARIRAEMQKILAELNYQGDFASFLQFLRTDKQFYTKSPDELLMHARDIAKRIDDQLPKYFSTLPRRPYGVVKVPDAIAPKYTGGRYSSPSKDTEAGHYLVNTYQLESRPLYVLPALTAHEAVPGHHLQMSLNSELGEAFPDFRRGLYFSAYGEGWGLYAEYLADEMGIYRTPYEKFGQLTYEMWRACRLVVDTGIHAFGWTRDQVVDYMKENTALSIHEINTETDRYIGWPAQALSYKIGELKIRELRTKAEKELGEKFDVRAFHQVILDQGTVTLPILERRVNVYIRKQLIN